MKEIAVIDAHMHMWDLSKHRYPWLQEKAREMWIGDFSKLKQSYLIENYLQDIKDCNVVKSVHLQAQIGEEPIVESNWLQDIADDKGYPNAIIGFCNLTSSNATEIIEQHLQVKNIRGIRQDLNWHKDPFYRFCDDENIMQSPVFANNLKTLAKHNLSFDLQIYAAHQYKDAYEVVKNNEDVNFILNHSGAPYDRSEEGRSQWITGITKLAELPNLYTKLSGFDMYDHNWTVKSLGEPVLRVVDIFGPSHCMFASNFPVSSLYRSYKELLNAHRSNLSGLSEQEQKQIFHDNAARIYRI